MNKPFKALISLVLTVAALLSLAGATVAWLTISDTPIVSNLALYLVADNDKAFLIAPDVDGNPGEYGNFITLADASTKAASLRPITFSAKQYAFLLPEYGLDGRTKYGTSISLTDESETEYRHSPYISPAADSEILGGYLFRADFWVTSDVVPVNVSLAYPHVEEDGTVIAGTYLTGEPVWNDQTHVHDDGGKGSQYAIRIGLYIYGTEDNPNDNKFVIIEPNANGGNAVVYDGNYFTESADGSGMSLSDGDDRVSLIQQACSSWSEVDPILKDSVTYTGGTVLSENKILFSLGHGEQRKITLYLWLEGQDADCLNSIENGGIVASLAFAADMSDTPITPE